MFKPCIPAPGSPRVTIVLEGAPLEVPAGITVAAAVMGHARKDFIRISPADGEKRAPFCYMGVCHECLMEINGMPNQQACMIEVAHGMTVNRQTGLTEVSE